MVAGITLALVKQSCFSAYRAASNEVINCAPNSFNSFLTFASAVILTAQIGAKIILGISVGIADIFVLAGAWIGHRYANCKKYVQFLQIKQSEYKQVLKDLNALLERDEQNLAALNETVSSFGRYLDLLGAEITRYTLVTANQEVLNKREVEVMRLKEEVFAKMQKLQQLLKSLAEQQS